MCPSAGCLSQAPQRGALGLRPAAAAAACRERRARLAPAAAPCGAPRRSMRPGYAAPYRCSSLRCACRAPPLGQPPPRLRGGASTGPWLLPGWRHLVWSEPIWAGCRIALATRCMGAPLAGRGRTSARFSAADRPSACGYSPRWGWRQPRVRCKPKAGARPLSPDRCWAGAADPRRRLAARTRLGQPYPGPAGSAAQPNKAPASSSRAARLRRPPAGGPAAASGRHCAPSRWRTGAKYACAIASRLVSRSCAARAGQIGTRPGAGVRSAAAASSTTCAFPCRSRFSAS